MSEPKIRTYWECDRCGRLGRIDHRADAGAWQVVQAIGDAHREAGSLECPCREDIGNIQVRLGPVRSKRKRKAGR